MRHTETTAIRCVRRKNVLKRNAKPFQLAQGQRQHGEWSNCGSDLYKCQRLYNVAVQHTQKLRVGLASVKHQQDRKSLVGENGQRSARSCRIDRQRLVQRRETSQERTKSAIRHTDKRQEHIIIASPVKLESSSLRRRRTVMRTRKCDTTQTLWEEAAHWP